MDPLDILGPENVDAWMAALLGGDEAALERLVSNQPPDLVHLAILSFINNMYITGEEKSTVIAKIVRPHQRLQALRRSLGPRLRDIDLQLMRQIRRSGMLSIVLGAGATMAAGGPSWAELVRRMLQRVVSVKMGGREGAARQALELIESGRSDTEVLMEGAELCYQALGQKLFTHFHGVIYQDDRQPSEIHRAVAALATPARGAGPGWDCIISYNFDDLMGEAIDAVGKPRAAFAMRGDRMVGDPNELAQQEGRGGDYQRIYHLHGYTPRRLFRITNVRFVFSTSQFETLYPAGNEIVEHVFSHYLANPIHHALYVGCSFDDEAMNGSLREAWQSCPGRWHYAFLKWPGRKPYRDSSAAEINEASRDSMAIGVQPVWFDDFDELPGLIRRLE